MTIMSRQISWLVNAERIISNIEFIDQTKIVLLIKLEHTWYQYTRKSDQPDKHTFF